MNSSGATVTLAQVRVQISDQQKPCAPPGRYELLAAPADGVQNVFGLRFSKAILSSLTLAVQTPAQSAGAPSLGAPPAWTAVLPAGGSGVPAFTVGTDANGSPVVTFASAPAQGAILGVRYLVTMLTDAEISTYMGTENVGSTVTETLQRIHYALIPVLLADREASMVYRINDRTDDPSSFTKNLIALRAQLRADLSEQPDQDPVGFSAHSGYWY